MGDLKYVSTNEEKNIARELTDRRAKVFLESRAFIRECLSNLLNIEPLEIPLNAYPGQIPKITQDIGNISISHTQNVLIVIWHYEKIGIDIEKSNRQFNYQGLEKKYHLNNGKIKINKKDILNMWSAIEAAIKWEGGKLSKDIKKWKFTKNKSNIFHRDKKIKLQLHQFDYRGYIVSIAFKNELLKKNQLIICDKANNF